MTRRLCLEELEHAYESPSWWYDLGVEGVEEPLGITPPLSPEKLERHLAGGTTFVALIRGWRKLRGLPKAAP